MSIPSNGYIMIQVAGDSGPEFVHLYVTSIPIRLMLISEIPKPAFGDIDVRMTPAQGKMNAISKCLCIYFTVKVMYRQLTVNC